MQGTFDDCQDIVKALFRDLEFKKKYSLGAVNSINFARIMFQITYYFYTYFKMFPNCDGEMSFSVPTGNFGDVDPEPPMPSLPDDPADAMAEMMRRNSEGP